MKAAVAVPVTVKCRIGIDEQDPEESLDTLTRMVVAAGVDALIVHARKAWLDGLSPRENRDIPPLDYDRVYRLKRANPDLHISINGGIASVEQAAATSRRCRRRDDGPRRLSGAVAAARRRSARSTASPHPSPLPSRLSKHSFRTSIASLHAARGCIR